MSKSATARPRSTKKFRALVNAGLSDADALAILGVQEPQVDERVAQLVEAGFSEQEAADILAAAGSPTESAEPEPLTPKQQAEALVTEKGLTFSKGRVYTNRDILAAAVRVGRTGTAEVTATSGNGRVSAVLIYREESGDVAIQNLVQPA